MDQAPTIVWLRRDLRLADHPALAAAAAAGTVIPIHVEDGSGGAAARWWRHHSLDRLGAALAERGGRLVLEPGAPSRVLPALAAATGARRVQWNARPEPSEQAIEAEVAASLAAAGVESRRFAADLLFPPGRIGRGDGQPYQVFTPFWRAVQTAAAPPAPLPAPARLPAPPGLAAGVALAALDLLPRRDWAQGLAATWTPGEATAIARLERFLDGALDLYGSQRDRPDVDGTSLLSPHLAHGEISPRTVWHAVGARPSPGSEAFLRELAWREFSYGLLAGFPALPSQPLKPEFAAFPWASDAALVAAWRRGATGYPIVDAGMRQLWHTGWMHNRVRMIVASFLVKDLLTPWQEGEAWFADTLVDADTAINAASWQWVAGCGADAAPYFRVFNPALQGEKCDPRGRYVRRWVPELAGLPDLFIHRPWEAPAAALATAGVTLGGTYPRPVVEHGAARHRALAAYQHLRRLTEASPTPAA